MHQIPLHDQMVVERSRISHRSAKTSPKVNKTIARSSATFTRLPKTTANLAVMSGWQLVLRKCDWGIKLVWESFKTKYWVVYMYVVFKILFFSLDVYARIFRI